jgi:hypothetical protein
VNKAAALRVDQLLPVRVVMRVLVSLNKEWWAGAIGADVVPGRTEPTSRACYPARARRSREHRSAAARRRRRVDRRNEPLSGAVDTG